MRGHVSEWSCNETPGTIQQGNYIVAEVDETDLKKQVLFYCQLVSLDSTKVVITK